MFLRWHLLLFYYASLTSALAERLWTQEDCMVYRAEGATVAPQDITA